jgi:hypothetical protein
LNKLMGQFRVGEPSEDKLRRDLKAAAPHAFAKAAPPPPAPSRAAAPKPALREAPRPSPRPVAASASGNDWAEF